MVEFQFYLFQIKLLDLKVQSGSLVNKCQLNAMIVHVCMEVNVKKDGIDTFVNVSIQASLERLVEMVIIEAFK